MRVLLIGNYAPDAQESMLRFARLMQTELERRGQEVRLVSPRRRLGRDAGADAGTAKWLGYVDKFLLFPWELERELAWADVVHVCDHSNAVYIRRLHAIPHVVTCHDLIAIRSALNEFPGQRTGWTGRQLQRMILAGLRQARRIVCVSAATRADVLRLTQRPAARVTVVPNGLNYPFAPMDAADCRPRLARLGIPAGRPLLVHVGGNAWYKNREGVLRIFAAVLRQGVDATLVMVGKPWSAQMRLIASSSGLDGRAVEIVDADGEDLRALYSTAHALLFPSLYEGFGWPIIEAQACGCPVITTDRAPMSDIAGADAILIPAEDPQSAAKAIVSRWEAMVAQRLTGAANAAKYSVASMIDGYLREYAAVLA
jgi:glycosyltransferase involved in cell wall biosynthesis